MNSLCMKVKKQNFKIILLKYLLSQCRTASSSNFSFNKIMLLPNILLMKMFKCQLFKIRKLINLIKTSLLQWMILFHQVLEIFKINKTYIFKILICKLISFKEVKRLKFNKTKIKTNGTKTKKNMIILLYIQRKSNQIWILKN